MKITERQLQMLMVTLQDSQKNVVGLFSYDLEARNGLLNEIIKQQSDKLIDVKDEKEANVIKSVCNFHGNIELDSFGRCSRCNELLYVKNEHRDT